MEAMTAALLARFQARGEVRLDEISFELAVAVAAEIVGLTENQPKHMAPRIAAVLEGTLTTASGLQGRWKRLLGTLHALRFYWLDVRPAVRVRQGQRRDDIISQILDKGYSTRAIMIECMTYATAGMVTTREFITMVAWHLFDRPDLRQQFLEAGEAGQFALLEEILRLEPVAAMIQRRMATDGGMVAIDIRAVNGDEAVVGTCPHRIDPGRAARQGVNGGYLSFGDGPHVCPGRQVAMHEARIFLDQLFRVPGLRLLRAPDMGWNPVLMGYELRDARITCDRLT
jgi:cytochrome P450